MNKNEIIFFILIAVLLLGVVIYVFPTLDCFSIPVNRFGTLYVFSSVICTSGNNIITNIIGTMIFFIIMFIMAFKKENMIKVALIASPNIIWIGWIGCSGGWHIGILFLIIVFISIITNSINTKKSIYILFLILTIIHIYWNITCSINDINNNFSAGKSVSEYLKEVGYEDKKICGADYWSVQINPYFEENVLSNYPKSYFYWSRKYNSNNFSKIIIDDEKMYDIYIIPIYFYNFYINGKNYESHYTKTFQYESKLIEKLQKTKMYEIKYFEGNMYYKDKIAESTGLVVLVKQQ